LRQAERLEDEKAKLAALEKKLEENQGLTPTTNFPFSSLRLNLLT
jgi:hypothetical protein